MSGDAYMFCQAIGRRIRELGGTFQFESEVRSVKVVNGAVAGVEVSGSFLAAKNVIIAAGTASPELARQIGARLAIKPVKGYSLTFTPEPGQRLPAIPVIDDANHTAVTPLGNRLRSVGTAEFAGSNLQLDRERLRNLAEFFKAVFPEIATRKTLDTGQPWAGLRPVAADGRPYIGATRTRGLWINSGHGHLGWTLATGSARLLADLIVGRQTKIAAEPYAVAR
jgi:D-amino-acid dehydrogenase